MYGIEDETIALAFDLACTTHLTLFEAKVRRKELIFQAQLIAAAQLTGEAPSEEE